MGKPISEKHAIDVASFIVVFERPFEANIIDSLPGLHERLKADYPTFNLTNTMEVSVTGSEVSQKIGVTSGGLLQNLFPDGRPSWTLRVEGNAIVVVIVTPAGFSAVLRFSTFNNFPLNSCLSSNQP